MVLDPPTNPEEFFSWLKRESEQYWKSITISDGMYGFQIQQDTTWNPGLSDAQIDQFEKEVGCQFPNIYKIFLRHMNGMDKPSVNVYAESGEPYRYHPEYYSYPRDLHLMRKMIEWICEEFKIDVTDIDGQTIPFIIPIVGHRFLTTDTSGQVRILSMQGTDVIIYASSLQSFLINDIFNEHVWEGSQENITINFWLQ